MSADDDRIAHLAGDEGGEHLPVDDRLGLDALRDLLAGPSLWAEPSSGLEDAVVASIAAEAEAAAPPATGATSAVPPATGATSAVPPATGATSSVPPATGATGAVPPAPGATSSVPPVAAPPAPPTLTPPAPSAPTSTPFSTPAPPARRSRSRDRGRRRPIMWAALGAAAAIVLVVGLALAARRTGPSGAHFTAALQPTGLMPGASGSASLTQTTSGWRIELDASGLPRLDGGRFYQAWLKDAAGDLVPIGTFNEGQDVTLWAGVSPRDYPTITITEEQADGNQASSGQRVLVGNVKLGS